jgi:hypothetical protein
LLPTHAALPRFGLKTVLSFVTGGLARRASPKVDVFGGVTKSFTTGSGMFYPLQPDIANLPGPTGNYRGTITASARI